MLRITLIALVALLFATSADARPRKAVLASPDCGDLMPCEGVQRSARGVEIERQMPIGRAQNVYSGTVIAHPAGCPRRAFCMCGASVEVFGRPIRELYLSSNWFRFPRAEPAPGMVAVRRGHGFVLKHHVAGSTWLVIDHNSGGRKSRIHNRSIAGFRIVNPHGSKMAALQ